jgi:hypothetical protein
MGWGTCEGQGAHQFALWLCKPFDCRAGGQGDTGMIALRATSRAAVRELHAAVLARGSGCKEPPP